MKSPILTLLLLFSATLIAQKKKEDIIYLKNGGIIYGIIKERSNKIRIEINGGSIMVYETQEIDSMKQESLNKTLRRDFWAHYYRKTKGYRNISEAEFSYGPKHYPGYAYIGVDAFPYYGSGDDIGVGFHTVNGYQFNPYLFLGGGVGIDRLLTYRETFIPIYLRIQTEILDRRITPYFYVDVGYAFMPADQINNTEGFAYYNRYGGPYMTLGGGIHIYTRGPLSYMIGLGYRRHYSDVKYGYNDGGGYIYNYENKTTYERLVVSWGLTF